MAIPTIRRARRYCGWSMLSGVVGGAALPAHAAVTAQGASRVVAVAALVVCAALLSSVAWFWASAPPSWLLAAAFLATTGAWAGAAGNAQDPFWVAPASLAAGLVVMYQRGRRWAAFAVSTGLLTVVTVVAGNVGSSPGYADEALAGLLFCTVIATVGCVGNDRLWQLFVELDGARQLAGELAVARERLRFAADLHDVQGHTLQVIALKSELARRVAATNPLGAAAQMGEVEELARQALADTRDLAHGYRGVSFAAEVANAAEVLGAAGIECAYAPLPVLPAPVASLFGMVVREATTNILRHSSASTVSIAVAADGTRLTIRNDGADGGCSAGGGSAGGGGGSMTSGTSSGNGGGGGGSGLLGLDARLAEHGGAVRASRAAGVFEVVAEIGSSA